jgi:ATP-dependent DNA helicase RecG
MSELDECLVRLIRPFSLEEKMNFRNLSVLGGFDNYVKHWAREARKLATEEQVASRLDKVEELFSHYGYATSIKRGQIHRTSRLLLGEAQELRGEPAKRALQSPPSRGKSTAVSAAVSHAAVPEALREARSPACPPVKAAAHAKAPASSNAPAPAKPTCVSLTAKTSNAPLNAAAAASAGTQIAGRAREKYLPPLDSPVQYAKGVGPQLAKKIGKMGIMTIDDLLTHFPRRYEDRSQLASIADVQDGAFETVTGVVVAKKESRPRRGLVITRVIIDDGTSRLSLVWFNQPFRGAQLNPGLKLYASGRIERGFREIQMSNPEYEPVTDEDTVHTGRIVPIYPSTENLSQKVFRKILKSNLDAYAPHLEDLLPPYLRSSYNFPGYGEALGEVHFPPDFVRMAEARNRLVYEELFFLQLGLLMMKNEKQAAEKKRCYAIEDDFVGRFQQKLPFTLTDAQVRVVGEVLGDLCRATPMSRLVQGDVGSGKTVIAASALLAVVLAGFQGGIMAPTEILAEQHFKKFLQLLAPYDIRVGLLMGSLGRKEKESVRRQIRDGELKVVVGTHALIQEEVGFQNLGLVVVDEQHRFGVMQRAEFGRKGYNPDMLVMTATPIPRTLALTLYGDLDVSVVDELPPGRRKIKSRWCHFKDAPRVFDFVKKEICSGRQAYIVCPLIEESDKITARAATQEAESLGKKYFSDLRIALLHGKMKAAEKEDIMKDFRDGKIDVLISTTVIEVGVDVPNASVMVVQNADRFGMAQLHQLRGRVGRGEYQSHCFFIADPATDEGIQRMKIIEESEDGFLIAEKDLHLRGPGDYYGTRQHGLPELKISDLLRDHLVLERARRDAQALLKENPQLVESDSMKKRIQLNISDVQELIH